MPPVPSKAIAPTQARSGRLQRRQSWFQTVLAKLQSWTKQEIVSDDPWDVETLFPDSQEDSKSKPPEP